MNCLLKIDFTIGLKKTKINQTALAKFCYCTFIVLFVMRTGWYSSFRVIKQQFQFVELHVGMHDTHQID